MADFPDDRITVCDFRDDWFSLTLMRDPRVDPEPAVYSNFGFARQGQEFSYKGGWSKYANDHDKVTRITVSPKTITIEIDPSVTKAAPYVFDRLADGCRAAFLGYVQASPWLRQKLEITAE